MRWGDDMSTQYDGDGSQGGMLMVEMARPMHPAGVIHGKPRNQAGKIVGLIYRKGSACILVVTVLNYWSFTG